jgi:CRP-like cAMP-binding protein
MLPPVDSFARRTVAPGEVIFLEGQPADVAYVILKGEAQVTTRGAGGEEIVINRMTPGQMFGEVAILQPSGVRTATTISENGCELVVIERSFFDSSLNKADPLLRFVVDHLCKRLTALTVLVAQKS